MNGVFTMLCDEIDYACLVISTWICYKNILENILSGLVYKTGIESEEK